MDRAILEGHLAQAERHILESQRHVSRQREIVAELANDGHDFSSAEDLLAQFETMLAAHIDHRDRIRTELSEMSSRKSPMRVYAPRNNISQAQGHLAAHALQPRMWSPNL
jgi:hypothetical protein